MKNKILVAIIVILLITSLSWQPAATSAQNAAKNTSTYLPILYYNFSGIPSFGVEVHDLDDASIGALLPTKNTWIRYNNYYHGLKWSEYQPNNSTEFIRNTALENDLIKASQAGQKIILNIHGTPTWAQMYDGYFCGPMKAQNIADFASFVRQAVALYSQAPYNVEYFEIWNEPDAPIPFTSPQLKDEIYGCWGDDTKPFFGGGYYGEMLKVVYPALKAGNPQAQLVLGGLLLDCDPRNPIIYPSEGYSCKSNVEKHLSTFLEGILQAGGGPYIDMINFHTYSFYSPIDNPIVSETLPPNWKISGGQVKGKLSYIREMMTKYGIQDKPIMLSEAAYLCYSCAQDALPDFELKKSEYVVWLYTRNRARNISLTTWYTLDHYGWMSPPRYSGLLDLNNIPLPAYDAYKLLANKISDAQYVGENNTIPGVRIFDFLSDHRVWVAFSLDGQPKSLDFSLLPALPGTKVVTNIDGSPVEIPTSNVLTFDRPVYIEFIP